MIVRLLHQLAAAFLFVGLTGQAAVRAETTIPPMQHPIPGTWQDVSHLGDSLPIHFDSLWFEPESFSLIHVQTSDTQAPLSTDTIGAILAHMDGSVSFWGEPPHANAAQFFANQIYLQPSTYDELITQAIERLQSTGRLSETPGIWVLPEAEGNPHLFYHGQLTPRIALAVVDHRLNIGEAYVPHETTRNEFIRSGPAEAIVLEVRTLEPAIAEAVDQAGLPGWLKSERFAYCVVLHAENGFLEPRRAHIWLASPQSSSFDCDTLLTGLGISSP